MNNSRRKIYNGIDIAKFVFCIFVVAIHTMGKYGPYPFLRIAVPMFFCISSYLFFSHCNGDDDFGRLKRFLIRNAKLYSFWFVILLIPTLKLGGWLEGSILWNLIKFILKIFVGSTFAASWYIPALMIGTSLVFFLSKKLSNTTLLVCTLPIFLFCCLASNYRGLMTDGSIILNLVLMYPGTIYNSFPVGLFWIVLGKSIAEVESNYNPRKNVVCLIVSLVLLLIEFFVIKQIGCSVDNDCYVSLIPVCYFGLKLIINSKIEIQRRTAEFLRSSSTITYCFHGTFASLMKRIVFVGNLNFTASLALFAVSFFVSLLLSVIILRLSKKILCLKLAY